ncbi:MAG: DUF3006 domain-containing protein [Bacilli bacterium]|nr:DUF3006 domain-containing protein [Bacilli bacterium]
MDSKKLIVDQIIDDVAVLEDQGVMINVPVNELPNDIHDGSILILDENGYHVDVELEEEKKEDLRARLERLKNINNG